MHEAEILEALIDEKLREIELKVQTTQTTKPISSKPTRYLPVSVRREIFGRLLIRKAINKYEPLVIL